MSDPRGDCEHGHAADVLELADRIGQAHKLVVTGAVLVLIHREGTPATVIGHFNTTALVNASDAVLDECARHEPDAQHDLTEQRRLYRQASDDHARARRRGDRSAATRAVIRMGALRRKAAAIAGTS